jgi:hypothetical protein
VKPWGPVTMIAILGMALCRAGRADPQPKTVWLGGRAFQRQLGVVIDRAFWSGVALRQVIRTISTTQQIAILLDRRADPDRAIHLALSDVTVEALLERIAKDCRLGVTIVGPVVFLGPPEVAARLRTIALLRQEEVAKLPFEAARPWLPLQSLRWSDFAVPREVLMGVASAAGVEISGLKQVPHDLWAAADLPPLSLVDRITLITVQFDLTFRVAADGRSIDLMPIPDAPAIVRHYPGGRDPEQLARQWSRLAPDAQVKVVGREVYVRGLVEDHERITGVPRQAPRPGPERPPRRGPQEVRYTVNNTKGSLDRLLAELGQRLQVDVKIDHRALREAGISETQTVHFSVKDATVDELFHAVLDPAGCTFRRTGNVIEVVPAK